MKTEKVLWGVKQGNEDWQEEILSTMPLHFERIKELAAKDGYGRFRIGTIDLTVPPDFRKTIR